MSPNSQEIKKIIYLTQSSGLKLFYNLHLCLNEFETIENAGFYVSDSRFFNIFVKETPKFIISAFEILKEWEILKEATEANVNHSKLREYEKKIGYPVLWNALLADRRITWGKMFAFEQDYRPKYSHDQMLAILQTATQRIEEMFDKVKPDLVISFQCNGIGEYLSFLFAKSRGISFLNLRPTRIRNYFFAGEDIFEPSASLEETYRFLIKNGMPESLEKEVSEYLKNLRSSHAMYEGVVPASNMPPEFKHKKANISKLLTLIRSAKSTVKGEIEYRFGDLKHDNSIPGFISPILNKKILRPYRAKRIKRLLNNNYVKPEQLTNIPYAFFPLHPEPEVTVIVYSKHYLNQIEAVRLVSHNLPIGFKLIVKEHPWHVGKRSTGYYRKLLDIPNVLLAPPEMGSRELVINSSLITTISGSIGLEGLFMNIPVIVLGRAPFNFISRKMLRHISNPDYLGFEIRDLLQNYCKDENAIHSYVGAVMKDSVPVDFYSRLLKRKEAFNPELGDDEQNLDEKMMYQFRILADYIKHRHNKLSSKIDEID